MKFLQNEILKSWKRIHSHKCKTNSLKQLEYINQTIPSNKWKKTTTDELKPTIEKCMAQKFNLKDLLV